MNRIEREDVTKMKLCTQHKLPTLFKQLRENINQLQSVSKEGMYKTQALMLLAEIERMMKNE